MKKNYEKPELEILEIKIDEPIMDADITYSEGWDEDFG